MSDIAIRAEGLGKRYKIGRRERYRTIRDIISTSISTPFRRLTSINKKQVEDNGNRPSSIWALDDVSFEINKGEVVGIIGRNGAGKSTLLKILSRITKPTRGYADIYGRVGSLLEVGTGFHPELTGRENIYLNGAILGMRRAEIERKFDEIVGFSELEKFLDTPVKFYSSGMYMRLAFSVAAHLEPEILLVDEVLAVGDLEFQKKCLGKMGDVAHQGITVLFVSHNMAAIRKLCNQGILLDNGNVLCKGSTDTVIDQYLRESSRKNTTSIDLPILQTEIGYGVQVFTQNSLGEMSSEFKIGEKWKVQLQFNMLRNTKNVIAAIGIVTVDGIPLVTYWSKPEDLMKGLYQVTFEVNLPLKANSLQLAVGLSEHERNFYYVSNLGYITISEVSVSEQPFRSSGSGVLLGNQVSKIERVD